MYMFFARPSRRVEVEQPPEWNLIQKQTISEEKETSLKRYCESFLDTLLPPPSISAYYVVCSMNRKITPETTKRN